MCDTCGCNHEESLVKIFKPGVTVLSGIKPEKSRGGQREIKVKEGLLEKNQSIASANRALFNKRRIFALNLMGSPGSGKTTLAIQTIKALRSEMNICVVEGDQYGSLDSERIRETRVDVTQINTGNGCHLDANSVSQAIQKLPIKDHTLLIIENVGNLVCPALFDLGEHEKVVVFSVTEGDDKPIKYAPMFHEASICIINKVDLLDYVDFDLEKAKSNLKKINHKLRVFTLSSTKGTGMSEWIETLKKGMKAL